MSIMALMPFSVSSKFMPNMTSLIWKTNLLQTGKNISAKKFIHTTPKTCGLMEFFDDKKVWNETEIQVGRAWKADELRIKSNSDLHKLWYILLKERNMLMTMEHEAKTTTRLFANPERIDKVNASMDNLELVVRERNSAYHMLETGEKGERPAKLVSNQLGLRTVYHMCEHLVPKFMNTNWNEKVKHYYGGYAVRKFLTLYREKKYLEKRKKRNRDFNHVQHLFKRFPNMDIAKLKEDYPDIDIERAKQTKKSRGHFESSYN